eukprot:scaffold61313_cov56-Cyclotella_meneghiniana.AAC.2
MTDDSSPSKYDGYSAYLSTLSSDNTAVPSTSQPHNGRSTQDESSNGPSWTTPQKETSSESPPFTPSTPPPPPPVPTGGLPPLMPTSVPSGSFAEAVRPLMKSGSSSPSHDVPDDEKQNEVTSSQDENDNSQQNQMNTSPSKNSLPDEADTSQGDEDTPPQWEDFMAHYFNLPTPESSSQFQIHAHAQDILLAEDTDLKPCPMEPELDEEPYLSPIRTGCIDIDMEFKSPSVDELDDHHDVVSSSPMKELSHVGLECSRIMAKLHVGEIRQDAVSIATPIKKREVPKHCEEHEQQDENQFDLMSPNSFDDKRSVTSNTNTANSDKPPTEEWPSQKLSPLPSTNLIHSFGPILSRTSLRSLVMKKWSPSQWMHYGPHSLLLFRNKEQMDDWRYNPYHGKKAREYLVKQRIDFYGEMVAGEKEGKGGVLGHRILPVKRKSYGKNETEM